jgi:hypothetical protein
MEKYKLVSLLAAFVILACIFGAQGQYQTPASGYSSANPSSTQTMSNASTVSTQANASSYANPAASTSQYSQYYSMNTGSIPSTHISAPVKVDLLGKPPANVYFSTQSQAVPYSQYQSSAGSSGANTLWIQGSSDWTQYAIVPLGATVPLIVSSLTGGSGYLTEVHPDGKVYNTNFYFYPQSLMNFYADSVGSHIVAYTIGGVKSNSVVINVTGSIPPTVYDSFGAPLKIKLPEEAQKQSAPVRGVDWRWAIFGSVRP